MGEQRNIKLYVVDDEPSMLRILKLSFEEFGYTVTQADSGSQFFDQLDEENLPDILLLDVMMPTMSGYDVCERIKKDEKLKKIKVALYTALSESQIEDRAREVGADAWISKDVNLNELSEKIMRLIM